jgi:hypothetical protein
MSRRRRANPSKRTKRTDLTRTCSSGKRPFRQQGEADAHLRQRPNDALTSYQCEECKQWHLGNKTPRSVRRRRAKEGKPS